MSCRCGELKCSCYERCFCLSELCLCTVCFNLKENSAVKSEGRNVTLESSSNASTVSMKMERSNANNESKSSEDNRWIVSPPGGNLMSDLVSTESDKIKLESEKECSPNFIYPRITFSEGCELGTVPKQRDSAKVSGCSKKENILLKMKSDNKPVDLKLGNYKRYFEYFSSKVTNSERKKRGRSWKSCRKKGFKVLSRKAKYAQFGKRPASISQHNEVESEKESNKREVDEDEEYSKFNTFFTDVSSSGYSDCDTDDSKSTKTSTTSNRLLSLNIGGSFSEPEGAGCELSQTEPCSRCKRKKRMLSYYKSPQIKEMSMETARISKFQEGSSTSFREQIVPMPTSNVEKRIKKDVTESSAPLENNPNDSRNLSVYDFDEKESEMSSSDKNLNFRKRSVKFDNSGKLKINVYPISQASNFGESSQIDSVQNVDNGKMNSQTTNDNQYVSPLNASSSAGTLNDCVVVHESAGRIRKKMSSKMLRRMREKRRKTAKSKREESYIKKKIKREAKMKSEIKKEKGFSGKETSSIKKEIP